MLCVLIKSAVVVVGRPVDAACYQLEVTTRDAHRLAAADTRSSEPLLRSELLPSWITCSSSPSNRWFSRDGHLIPRRVPLRHRCSGAGDEGQVCAPFVMFLVAPPLSVPPLLARQWPRARSAPHTRAPLNANQGEFIIQSRTIRTRAPASCRNAQSELEIEQDSRWNICQPEYSCRLARPPLRGIFLSPVNYSFRLEGHTSRREREPTMEIYSVRYCARQRHGSRAAPQVAPTRAPAATDGDKLTPPIGARNLIMQLLPLLQPMAWHEKREKNNFCFWFSRVSPSDKNDQHCKRASADFSSRISPAGPALTPKWPVNGHKQSAAGHQSRATILEAQRGVEKH